jgi:hypothetical protein
LDFLLLWFLEFCFPREGIDVARDWPKKRIYVEENGRNTGKGKGRGRGKGGTGREQGGSRVSVMVKESIGNGFGKKEINV